MNNATTWEEFRQACTYSYLPGENMVWADRIGNIGWQVVGIAPIRKGWDGLLPVPGNGQYEWQGYLPVTQLPHVVNPAQGFWVTANENLVPPNYPQRNALGWEWADSSRGNRIREVLLAKPALEPADMMALQTDYTSLPAKQLIAYLKPLTHPDPVAEKARQMLTQWNGLLSSTSVEAGVYMMWERTLTTRAHQLMVPPQARQLMRTIPIRKVINWLKANRPELGHRDSFLLSTLAEACRLLEKKLGSDMRNWHYGQAAYHHVLIRHPMHQAVNDSLRRLLQCGPAPRGGSATTPNVTGNADNQTHGATFRMVADLSDWDNCWFTNAPGQSGEVASPYFNNLFQSWAEDRFFKVYFTPEKVRATATHRLTLLPE
jgi:penicillin amidase